MSNLESIFGARGQLSRILPNYRPRSEQAAMAAAVENAIAEQRPLIAEAGTGTGKTFAYLVPALQSGRRILISTGTRNLQDQLFRKDLPLVGKALGMPFHAALLKGRANYLCRYRLENVLGFLDGYSRADAAHLESLLRWSRVTKAGDVAEVTDVPEYSFLWRSVTSTAENCLGQDCPAYGRCCPAAARRQAHEADVVVINHHLLWADWVLKSDGFGELLPKADVIIVDEAHQFTESASQFLGTSLSSRQLDELAQDIRLELGRQPAAGSGLWTDLDRLAEHCSALRLAFGGGAERRAWNEVGEAGAVLQGCEALQVQLAKLNEDLGTIAGGNKGLESCRQRAADLRNRLLAFLEQNDANCIRWLEVRRRGFRMNQTPIDIAADFRAFQEHTAATWIFTSATLSNAGRFDHFSTLLGLEEPATFVSESPFDYRHQALMYLPTGLPDPSSIDYTDRIIDASLPVLAASGGRAFFLFTSHQALNAAAERLRSQADFPMFVQGDRPKAPLLELFKRSGNGILLGTASFWEGVDVRGPALSCVIIDKLPFSSPGDPVLSARLRALRQRGEDPFRALQLPSAVLSLKQGVGRLIRDVGDRGVLMLCDPRLLNRPYGKVFRANLPPMPITRSIGDVQAFFAEAAETAPA